MKVLGIRDIIGPIMIGRQAATPQAHCASRSCCRRLLAGEPRKATFTLYGSFAHTYRGHGTDKALVAGLLGMATDDLRIRESSTWRKKPGSSSPSCPLPTSRASTPTRWISK